MFCCKFGLPYSLICVRTTYPGETVLTANFLPTAQILGKLILSSKKFDSSRLGLIINDHITTLKEEDSHIAVRVSVPEDVHPLTARPWHQ